MTSLALWTCVFMVVAYFFCGIPFGLLISRAMAGVDVRTTGSGNIGMTNVARSVGKGAAVLTLACDLGKGLLVMTVARWAIAELALGGDASSLAATGSNGLATSCLYAACVLGHIFSPYLHFHGGKGIAVGFGACLGYHAGVAWSLLAVFAVFALPSGYVSVGSIAAAISLPVLSLVFGVPALTTLPVAVVAAVVVWAHRANIQKLRNGTESKFTFKKKDAPAEGGTDAVEPAVVEPAASVDAESVAEPAADAAEPADASDEEVS